MKYKPDESTIISYLYEELEEGQREKVEKYFLDNPEELRQVQQLADVLGIMGKAKDKEVIAPPLFMDDNKVRPFWSYTSFRTIVGIAASFVLILVAARLLQTEVNYSKGELRISFGERQPVEQVIQPNTLAGLTAAEVQNMIDQAVAQNNQLAETRLTENQQKLNRTIQASLAANSEKLDALVQQASLVSQEQVRTFVASLQNENLQLMKDYLQLSSADQKKYVENLLVDFSKYLQEQRNQDLQMFQSKFTSIEQNTNVFKQETEQILANIISNGGNSSKKNNY
jgi:hypothetical protein